MRDPLSRDFSSLQPSQDSWLHRVRDNFHQLLAPSRIFPSSANGAPLHLLTFKRTSAAGGARTVSLLTHAACSRNCPLEFTFARTRSRKNGG